MDFNRTYILLPFGHSVVISTIYVVVNILESEGLFKLRIMEDEGDIKSNISHPNI